MITFILQNVKQTVQDAGKTGRIPFHHGVDRMTFVIRGAAGIAVVLSALLVLGLGIGPVAAAGTVQAGNQTAMHGHASGFHFAANNSHPYTGAGFNLTSSKAAGAITKNATAGTAGSRFGETGRAGNATCQKKAPGFAGNATMQQERLQKLVTGLQQKGVDVSAFQTAIANNDTAAEKTWFTSYYLTNREQSGNTTRPQWHLRNATASRSA
jgi:hypothetical protein